MPNSRFFAVISSNARKAMVALVLVVCAVNPALASGPSDNRILNYQIRLTNASGVAVADGTIGIKLTFYTLSAGGTQLYTACSADGSATGTPTAVTATVSSGTSTILIGNTGLTCASGSAVAIPATLFNNSAIYLGVTVAADAEMTPRKRVVASGYAMNADRLDDLETSSAGGANAFVPITDSSGNLTLSANVTVDTNSFFVDSANNRVGIGTAAPLTTLDLVGNVRTTGKATAVLTGSIDPAASTTVTGVGTLFTTQLVVGDRITVSGETRTVTAIASNTSLTVDTAFTDNANDTSPDALYALSTARLSSNAFAYGINDLGKVGLGRTATSTDSLRILNTSATDNAIAIERNNNDGRLFFLRYTTVGDAEFGTTSTDGIMFVTANAQRGFWSETGDLGIGDTTPAALFTVGSGDLFQVNSSGNVTFNQTAPTVAIGNTGTLAFTDGTNTLCSIVDNGTTGDLTCTGTAGSFANRALSNLAAVAINTSLLPGTDDTIDLGDNTHRWRDLFLGPATLHIGTSTAAEGTISYTDAGQDIVNYGSDATGNADIAFFTDDLYLDKSAGTVSIGTATPVAGTGTGQLTIDGGLNIPLVVHSQYAVGAEFFTHSDTGFRAPVIDTYRSRNTAASPAAVQTGDMLGYLSMNGHDGSAYAGGFTIQTAAAQNWTGAAHGVQTSISAPINGSTVQSERLQFGYNGNLSINGNSALPRTNLDVYGNLRTTGKAAGVLTGSIDPTASTSVTGVGTLFTTELVIGDRITVNGETRTVSAIASATSLTVDGAFTDTANDTSVDVLYSFLTMRNSAGALRLLVDSDGSLVFQSAVTNGHGMMISDQVTPTDRKSYIRIAGAVSEDIHMNGGSNDSGNPGTLYLNTSNNGTTLISTPGLGNVGIGFNVPVAKLDVGGNVRTTGRTTAVLTGSIDPAASTTVTGVGTLFTTQLVVGDRITVTGETRTVTAIASNTSLTVDTAFSNNANDTAPDALYALSSERLSSGTTVNVTSDLGYVGINNVAPQTILHTKGAPVRFETAVTAGVQTALQLVHGNAVATDTVSLDMFPRGLTTGAQSSIRSLGTAGPNSDIQFHTSLSAALNERMRIDANGMVLIGTTTSGTNRLDVNYTTTAASGPSIGVYSLVTANPAGATASGTTYRAMTYQVVTSANAIDHTNSVLYGVNGQATHNGTGTLGNMTGITSGLFNGSTGTVSSAIAFTFGSSNPSGTISSMVGYQAPDASSLASTYYAFQGLATAGTNKYNLYMSGTASSHIAGNLGLGTVTTPTYLLDVAQTFTAADTSQRLANLVLTDSGTSTTGSIFKRGQYTQVIPSGTVSGGTSNVRAGEFEIADSSSVSGGTRNAHGIYSSSTYTGTPSGTSAINLYGGHLSSHYNGGASVAGSTLRSYGLNVNTNGEMGVTGNTGHIGLYLNSTGSADNNYGIIVNAVTGATDNNYGIYINSVSGGTNNYSLYNVSSAQSYFAGNVGIGDLTPDARLDVDHSFSTANAGSIGASITYTNTANIDATSTQIEHTGLAVTQNASGTYVYENSPENPYLRGIVSDMNFSGTFGSDDGTDIFTMNGIESNVAWSGTLPGGGLVSGDEARVRGISSIVTGNMTDGPGTTEKYGGYMAATGTAGVNYGLMVSASGATDNFALYASGTTKSYFGGSVGIGDTTPDFALDVELASGTVAGFNRLTNDGIIIALQQDGTTEGDISVSGTTISYNAFTGSHYAWTSAPIERGMLVRMSGTNRSLHGNPESEVLYGIAPTQEANDDKVMGAYLSLQTPSELASDENPHLVMAVGNGEVWVSENASGNIARGEYLISSDITGHAMKDAGDYGVSHIIARAAEDVDWSTVTETTNGVKHKKISIFFESFDKYSTGKYFAVNGNSTAGLAIEDTQGNDLAFFGAAGDALISANLSLGEGKIGTAAGWVAKKSGFAETYPSTDALIPGEIVMVDTENADNVRRASAEVSAYLTIGIVAPEQVGFLAGPQDVGRYPITGFGKADVKVTAENGPVAIGDPVTVSATVPGVGMKATQNTYIVGIALESWDGEGIGNVQVFVKTGWWNGSTVVEGGNFDTSNGQNLTTITGPVVLADAPILGVHSIEGAGGTWRIDAGGFMTMAEIVAQKVTSKDFTVKVTDTTQTAGKGTMFMGSRAAVIANPALKADSQVFVTFRADPGSRWWIDEQHDGSFIVMTADPVLADVSFTYWILGVADERTPPSEIASDPEPTQEPAPETTEEPLVDEGGFEEGSTPETPVEVEE